MGGFGLFFFLFGFWSADGQPLTSGLWFYFLPGKRGCEINEELGRKLGSGRCWLGAAPRFVPSQGNSSLPEDVHPSSELPCAARHLEAAALGFGVHLLWVFGVNLLCFSGCICSGAWGAFAPSPAPSASSRLDGKRPHHGAVFSPKCFSPSHKQEERMETRLGLRGSEGGEGDGWETSNGAEGTDPGGALAAGTSLAGSRKVQKVI